MTLVSIPLMDRTGRRTLHLYGLGGMFIFSIFITISFLIKARLDFYVGVKLKIIGFLTCFNDKEIIFLLVFCEYFWVRL